MLELFNNILRTKKMTITWDYMFIRINENTQSFIIIMKLNKWVAHEIMKTINQAIIKKNIKYIW